MLDQSQLDFYAQPGPITQFDRHAHQIDDLPIEPQAVVKSIQNLMIHIFWAESYGLQLTDQRKEEVNYRFVEKQVARLLELNPAPLTTPRSLETRLVGNCRDFSTILAAILRRKGIPARARCGFGTYFIPGHFEDHWMTEVWDSTQSRWLQMDAQLDTHQINVLKITFNPLDMPAGAFVVAADAWQRCRSGNADPNNFGIFEYKGWDFIRGNLIRDFLSLNKIEILPWDFWEAMQPELAQSPTTTWEFYDHLARLTIAPDIHFDTIRQTLAEHPELIPPFIQ